MLRSITRSDSNQSAVGSSSNSMTSVNSPKRTGSIDGTSSSSSTYGSNQSGLQNVTSIPFGVLTSTSVSCSNNSIGVASSSSSCKMTKITLPPSSSSVNQFHQSYQLPHSSSVEQFSLNRLPQVSCRSHSLTPPSPSSQIIPNEHHYEFLGSHQRSNNSPLSSQTQLSPQQTQATSVKHRLHTMMSGSHHRMIPVNSAVAFPPVSSSSSSSCASSGSNSNPPSVPTTPESQSSERLSSITRSQPDLSKLEELEMLLARTNIGGSNSQHNNDLITHHEDVLYHNVQHALSGQSYPSQQQVCYNESSSGSRNNFYPHESIYSNAQLSHSNSSSVNSNTSGVSGSSNNINNSLNHLNSQYNNSSNNINHVYGHLHHHRRGSDNSPDANHSLPPPSPPKSSSRLNNNSYSRQLHYDHEYQNQQNLNELLILENRELKNEVNLLRKKITRFEQLEAEVSRVHSAHEELMRSAEKKEKLERAVRYKLEIEVKRLQAENRELREQNSQALAVAIAAATNNINACNNNINNASGSLFSSNGLNNHHHQVVSGGGIIVNSTSQSLSAPSSPRSKFMPHSPSLSIVNHLPSPPAAFASDAPSSSSSSDVVLLNEQQQQLSQDASNSGPSPSSSSAQKERDLLIAQLLVTENKELRADKEIQEYELQAQRLTLEEQRKYIEQLDNAFKTAQANVAKLEAELRERSNASASSLSSSLNVMNVTPLSSASSSQTVLFQPESSSSLSSPVDTHHLPRSSNNSTSGIDSS